MKLKRQQVQLTKIITPLAQLTAILINRSRSVLTLMTWQTLRRHGFASAWKKYTLLSLSSSGTVSMKCFDISNDHVLILVLKFTLRNVLLIVCSKSWLESTNEKYEQFYWTSKSTLNLIIKFRWWYYDTVSVRTIVYFLRQREKVQSIS